MRTCVVCGDEEPTARTTCKGCGTALPPADLLALDGMDGARPPAAAGRSSAFGASRPVGRPGGSTAARARRAPSGRAVAGATLVLGALAVALVVAWPGGEDRPPLAVAGYVDGAPGHDWRAADGAIAVVLPSAPVPEQRDLAVGGVTVPADGVAASVDLDGVYVALAGTIAVPTGIGLDPDRVDPSALAGLPALGGAIEDARVVDHAGRPAVDVRLDLPDGLGARARLVPIGGGRVAVAAIVSDLAGPPGFERLAGSMQVPAPPAT